MKKNPPKCKKLLAATVNGAASSFYISVCEGESRFYPRVIHNIHNVIHRLASKRKGMFPVLPHHIHNCHIAVCPHHCPRAREG